MRLKLDENLGRRGALLLDKAGHDVSTVVSQGLCSAHDDTLIEVCRVEGRALVTLDMDFANTLRFPPGRYAGIIVLRLAGPIGLPSIDDALERVLTFAGSRDPVGRLWIVDERRIREFVSDDHDS